jgi:hypothetical protein
MHRVLRFVNFWSGAFALVTGFFTVAMLSLTSQEIAERTAPILPGGHAPAAAAGEWWAVALATTLLLLWFAAWAAPFFLAWHALGTNIPPGRTRVARWVNQAFVAAMVLLIVALLAYGAGSGSLARHFGAVLWCLPLGGLAAYNTAIFRRLARDELKMVRLEDFSRGDPIMEVTNPRTARSSVGDIDMFVTMLATARRDPSVNGYLERLLSLPDKERQGLVHAWVSDLLIAEAPRDFIQCVACLLDDRVAEKAYEVIYKRKRDGNP